MLRLHDTLTRQVVPVAPAGSRVLRMYTCAAHGPAGLADLRPALLADLVRRVAERANLRVLACRNVSDLVHRDGGEGGDDRDERDGRDVNGASLDADTLALNMRAPEHSPRTSETMGLVIELIGRLIERGHAYATPEGAVFFDAASFPTYGEISGKPGSASDWPLWEPVSQSLGHSAGGDAGAAWNAPWGRGLPGRDVECSATPLRFLGPHFDLYVGGADLCFPHHERARAQSNAATGQEAAAHWAHSGHLLFEGRPADTGHVVPLSGVVAAGLDPLAVRLALLEHHYRRPVDLTWDALHAADEELRRLRRRVAEWAESPSRPIDDAHSERVQRALDDDLDTPGALRLLRDLEADESVAPGSRFETFLHFDHVLALDLPADIGRI
ncbi:cysteine--tRNA ligase [Microbispora sp. NBRC 16548]|uniref:cysteine--tRNA ligase n=1 Tax=Microbispora sp. NBRC 16548 TaxID=3030994 RepID=UPI0024A164EF|nr:cysteine--tRNA ligase [Microbispora sp. NBRC 16548]GLX08530.1 cysteine--tRNA ligase [Microbispora sp. NBRC 16548]